MHCPVCGQQQVSEETRYCSRCGFLLTGVTQLINNGGVITSQNLPVQSGKAKKDSPRRKGIKQGLFIFLLSFLIVPLLVIATIAANVREPFAVVIAAIILTVGGLLRMAYAVMFQSDEPYDKKSLEDANIFDTAAQNFVRGANQSAGALPPQQSIPASSYMPPKAGNWRDTNDLTGEPSSVTERTTKFLDENN